MTIHNHHKTQYITEKPDGLRHTYRGGTHPTRLTEWDTKYGSKNGHDTAAWKRIWQTHPQRCDHHQRMWTPDGNSMPCLLCGIECA